MKLLLFLGAGVSVPSGLPTVDQLTSSIFRRAYHQDSNVHFSPGKQPMSSLLTTDATPRIRQLLKLLRNHDRHDRNRVGYCPSGRYSSGAIYRGSTTTYEDLYHLCQQMGNWSDGLVDNSFVTPLMEIIQRKAGTLLVRGSSLARMSELGRLADQACAFIESVVAAELLPKQVVGFDVIRQLANEPYIEQLNVVTLNHDWLVEQFLTNNSVPFRDGFGDRDGDVRWYDDRNYDVDHAKVVILKLHGSINWYVFVAGAKQIPAIVIGSDTNNIKDRNGARLAPVFDRPSFLSGMSKAAQYHRGIYADIHFRFQKLLRDCELMVMSGYGWGDTAITFQVQSWLKRRPKNRLIHLHKTPSSVVHNSQTFQSNYDSWIEGGQLIPVHKWLCEVALDELKTHFIASETQAIDAVP